MNFSIQINPECIATVLAYAVIFQSTITSLAPTSAIRHYGGIEIEKDSSNHMILRRSGYKGLNVGIYIFCLVTKGYDMKIPVAFNSLIWVAESLSTILNKKSKKIAPELLILFIAAWPVIAVLTESDFYLAWRVQVIISSLMLTMAAVNPKLTLKQWAIEDIDDITYALVAMDAWIYSNLIILSALLAWNQDPLTSVGYTCLISVFSSTIILFFNRDVAKLKMHKGMQTVWPIMDATVAYSILTN